MNFYRLLGVAYNATPDEIKKAYRKKVKIFHPDVNPDGEEVFKLLNVAYETLINPDKREQYDKLLNKNSLLKVFEDKLLEFLGFTDKPQKGSDIRTTVTVSLEDGLLGRKKTIKYKRKVLCPDCEGNGIVKESRLIKCDKCSGEGRIQTKLGKIVCFKCLGKGFVVKNPCGRCGGLGYTKEDQYISFKVPIGVETGDKLTVKSMGNCGLNGGEYGNLIIRFILDTGIFEKTSDGLILNVKLEKDISEYEYIRIKNPSNEVLQIKIPPNATKNQLIKISQEGYINKSGERTNLYIRFI